MKNDRLQNPSPKIHLWKNRFFLVTTCAYLLILFLVSAIACFFSYRQRREEAISDMDFTFKLLEQDYSSAIENFWQIYMPIFENRDYTFDVISHYFSPNSDSELTPLERSDLLNVLKQMVIRDNRVQWVGLFSDYRETNYILFATGRTLQVMPEDFPYLADMENKQYQMEVYGMQPIEGPSSTLQTFAICGGVPFKMGGGKVIAGYSLGSYEQICQNADKPLDSLEYMLSSRDQIIFHSGQIYDESSLYLPDGNYEGTVSDPDGNTLYTHAALCGPNTPVLSYQYSPRELFWYSHANTPLILLFVLLFALLSIFVYQIMLRQLSGEVSVIRHGLQEIGRNKLSYCIPTDMKQPELKEIAESINLMTSSLSENINRAYYYEIKQKEAELSELQSKFNPHFLYNCLEMICSRCYQNGDSKTANLINQLAAIFRGFIGAKNFIPLHEELTFSKRYLSLFNARYRDLVEIEYAIDTELLQYGIIRNVFQPLIENYFVHGFELSSTEHNYIRFRGQSLDSHAMLITVEDNGAGMSDDALAKLNAELLSSIKTDQESYGLKNLHQRLRLFYGGDCGITVIRNEPHGLVIQMKLLKMTCEEYEASRQDA